MSASTDPNPAGNTWTHNVPVPNDDNFAFTPNTQDTPGEASQATESTRPVLGGSSASDLEHGSNRDNHTTLKKESDSQPGHQAKKSKSRLTEWGSSLRLHRNINIFKGWTLEFWASLLSITTFTSIIIVLKEYDGQPQTTWSYNHLTLNGLIALLASITRAALVVAIAAAIGQGKWNWFVRSPDSRGSSPVRERRLGDLEAFDEASRGAWGSLKLLKRLRCWHLCSIGAMLTILVLGFDTFAQQVVTIAVRDVPNLLSGALPNVPRSQYYDSSNFISDTMQDILVATLPMKSAVYNGIMNQNLTELPITCATGNCTWPIVPTLAVCGACVDLTPNITKHCNSNYCNYTLPSGRMFNGQIRDIPYSFYNAGRTFYELGSPFPLEPFSRAWSNTIPEVPAYIGVFQAIGAKYQAQDLSTVTASECALWLCIQAFNVSTENGVSTRTEVKTWSQAEASDIFDYNFTNIPFEAFNMPEGTQYGSSKASLGAISDSVSQYFAGKVTGFQEVGIPGNPWQYNFTSDTIQAFWQGSANYTAFINNLATSVSDTIRLTAPARGNQDNDARYAGTAYSSQPYVHVRWPWLTYPASILVASLVFLFATIDQTRRRKVRVWKGSATALLFSRVDGDDAWLWNRAEMHAKDGTELTRTLDDHRVSVAQQREFWLFKSIQ